jgi:isohexenylglutaconyl-CoA hydratase
MVNTTPQVVVAAVEGYAIAGGFGILCVSDVAICTEDAGFAMSETAIGIVPAQIAPFVANRIGVPQTRHLALTAARFKGPEALRLGIVHHLVKDQAALDAKLEEVLKQIDRCAPLANALTKAVVMKVGSEPLSSVLDFAADKFAEARRSPEAAEGLRAFAEKRPPKWATE